MMENEKKNSQLWFCLLPSTPLYVFTPELQIAFASGSEKCERSEKEEFRSLHVFLYRNMYA
jgi:hypothetical protein